MKLRVYNILALLFFSFLVLATSCLAAPSIDFEKTTLDIGAPIEGEVVNLAFSFKNIGDSDLQISEIKVSCGCSNAKATETVIAPGKSADIKVSFNSTGFRGSVRKTVTVTTNDPEHETVELVLKGVVSVAAEIKPKPFLNLGDMKPGEIQTHTITLTPQLQKPFKIVDVKSAGKIVTVVRFDKDKNKDGDFIVKMQINPGTNPGRFFGSLSIVTDLPNDLAIRFPIYGNIVKSEQNGD